MTASTRARRVVLLGVAGAVAAAVLGPAAAPTRGPAAAPAGGPVTIPTNEPLWRVARERGLVYGSSAATWQLDDSDYARLFDARAELLFTEDDLLWYKVKPSVDAPLDFNSADRLFAHAEQHRQLVVAAHLVWDEGFGDGFSEDDLWGLGAAEARTLLFGTAKAVLDRYRGRVVGWIVANEVTGPEGDGGFRTDVPWYATIGKSYVREMFQLARQRDPKATLVLNEYGFETTNEDGDDPHDRQQATRQVIDTLLAEHAPVDALGIQAHLLATDFATRFDRQRYRKFLDEVSDRGLDILITELDVLDDGLPADGRSRDQEVADVYARYLDVPLAHGAVRAVMSFGLSDRYTWLQEEDPRDDGAERRPLVYDSDLVAKPALQTVHAVLARARRQQPLWRSRRRG